MNPNAINLLTHLEFPIEGLRSKSWDEFAVPGSPHLDFVITVCDNAAGEVCPFWPGQPMTAHWGIPDPAAVEGSDIEPSIIIVSSIAVLLGSATIGAYGVSKAADIQLARNLAVEYGPHNVRVNCIAPGVIKTSFSRALWEDADVEARVTQQCPLRRFGEPDDVAGVAVMLAAPAGRYVTGQTIVVDGGDTIV